jgi:hypothetical protein
LLVVELAVMVEVLVLLAAVVPEDIKRELVLQQALQQVMF